MHVRGFKEEGTTTTPFDMVVLNELDRFHLAIEVIERVPGLGIAAAHTKQQFRDALIEHSHYVREHGQDMPKIRNWVWPGSADDRLFKLFTSRVTRKVAAMPSTLAGRNA